jgi:acyl-coenzyme A synthetase/AMP-(fatty) acid ligase/thioesterase domain-containing protein/acyl carrier protein
LQGRVEVFASCLAACGVGRTDRLALALSPSPDSIAAVLASLTVSACIPVSPEACPTDLASTLRRTGATALLASPDCSPAAIDAARRAGVRIIEPAWNLPCDSPPVQAGRDSEDVALILSSSGTTAVPKVIPVTQTMLRHRAHNVRNFLELTPADRCMGLMPMFHGGGLLIPVLGSLFAGASVAIPGAFRIEEFEQVVEELNPTWVAVPPPFVERLLSDDCPWSGRYRGLRAFFTGGAPMSPKSAEAVERKFGVILQNGYGSTECGGIAANPMPPGVRKSASVGVTIGPEIAILNEQGNEVAPGVTGEVAVSGPGVFRGYETPEGLDASSLIGGHHRTGDAGHKDADGYLFLTGRFNDVINRGGEKFSPEEVEAMLRRHPSVADAAVFPVPHPAMGQEAAALVVGRGGIVDVADVLAFATRELTRAKVPSAILAVDSIPTNAAGKVQRAQLAGIFAEQLHASRTARAEYAPPRTPIETRIADAWAEMLKVERVGLHDRFADLGGDSLLAVSMVTDLSAKLGCEIPVSELWRSPTVASLAAFVSSRPTRDSSLLFPVWTTGTLPPLFSVLPGWFPEIEQLSRYLGPDQPLYALIPDPRPGGAQEGMAADRIVEDCVKAIRDVRPEGPYLLMGRSIGGTVAVNIATELQASGQSVAFVGLLDTNYLGVPGHRTLPTILRLTERFMGELISKPRPEWRSYIFSIPGRVLRRRARRKMEPAQAQLAARAMDTRLERVFLTAPARRFEGTLTLFAAEESLLRGFIDRRIYWSRGATEGVELHLLPGTHNMMTQEPLLGGFAEVLRGCLTRALLR